MPTNSMTIIRPDYYDAPYDITRYGAAFFTQIIDAANSVGLPTIDLHADNATRTNFENTLTTQDPLLVNIFGHGNYNIITCQYDEILLNGGLNTNILSGRVVYNLSCQAGKDLGDHAVREGCVSFLGYDEDFILYIDDRVPNGQELTDEVARGFFESHNAAPITFIRGGGISNSYHTSQDSFSYWIKVWESIDIFVATELMWDRDHQVIKPTIGPAPGGLLPALLMFAPLLIIPTLKKFK